jgi:ABC-type multidrug transport system ATPase subunit
VLARAQCASIRLSSLWAVIRELVAEGTTLLLTSQYMEEADHLADRIAVIDHGQVIADGSPR